MSVQFERVALLLQVMDGCLARPMEKALHDLAEYELLKLCDVAADDLVKLRERDRVEAKQREEAAVAKRKAEAEAEAKKEAQLKVDSEARAKVEVDRWRQTTKEHDVVAGPLTTNGDVIRRDI